MQPVIDMDKCTGIGECARVCPVDVFEMGEDGMPKIVRPDKCIQCRACVVACPLEAITLI